MKKTSKQLFEYGICNGTKARRNKKTGEVQFVLWEKGEQGHEEDLWIKFDKSWWPDFAPKKQKPSEEDLKHYRKESNRMWLAIGILALLIYSIYLITKK